MDLTDSSAQSYIYFGGVNSQNSISDFKWVPNYSGSPYCTQLAKNLTIGKSVLSPFAGKLFTFDSGSSYIYVPVADMTSVINNFNQQGMVC